MVYVHIQRERYKNGCLSFKTSLCHSKCHSVSDFLPKFGKCLFVLVAGVIFSGQTELICNRNLELLKRIKGECKGNINWQTFFHEAKWNLTFLSHYIIEYAMLPHNWYPFFLDRIKFILQCTLQWSERKKYLICFWKYILQVWLACHANFASKWDVLMKEEEQIDLYNEEKVFPPTLSFD